MAAIQTAIELNECFIWHYGCSQSCNSADVRYAAGNVDGY